MKVFFLWEHLPFTPAFYLTSVVGLSMYTSDIKSMFLWLSNRPHPSCTHFAVCATYSPRARDSVPKYFLGLPQYTEAGIQGTWEVGYCRADHAWLNSLSSSWWNCDGHVPLLGQWSLHISWWKGRHGGGQDKYHWEVAAKGKLWACCWRGKGTWWQWTWNMLTYPMLSLTSSWSFQYSFPSAIPGSWDSWECLEQRVTLSGGGTI